MPDEVKDDVSNEGKKPVESKTPSEGDGGKGSEGDPAKPEEKKEVTWEEFQQLKSTNERLLKESKEKGSELKKLKAEEEAKANKKLEDEKKYPELLEKERKRIKEVEERVLAQGIAFEIQTKCADAEDLDLITKLIVIGDDNLDKENLVITDLSQQLDKIRETKPFLFKAKGAPMNNKVPGYKPKEAEVSISNMNREQLSNKVGELLAGKHT